jgi:hypothetical protein
VPYVFAEGLELVLGEVLPLLDLDDPQIQIHLARRLGISGADSGSRLGFGGRDGRDWRLDFGGRRRFDSIGVCTGRAASGNFF